MFTTINSNANIAHLTHTTGVLPLSLQAAMASTRKSAKASTISFFIFIAVVLLCMV
ncbi:hypothetical protein PDQ40_23545 [Bacillus cereus group sp. Bc061]|uniref:hypothetical protein n=1 Tax=Bacillus cereus group sp. Bc061 TaxID=3018117 RepID=UPI0015E7FD40|nr:hypothetical protein [Bacillus cereus group sp. Bc061]MDA2598625.1 hypothetical protein [Bacillus cereus group sp. Bc061]